LNLCGKVFSRADARPQEVCAKIHLANVCNGFIAVTIYSPGGRQWQLLLKFGHPARIGSPHTHIFKCNFLSTAREIRNLGTAMRGQTGTQTFCFVPVFVIEFGNPLLSR
jgi:hypothetical protein